jgi:hypothetical protein
MYYYWLKKVVQEKWHQTNEKKLPKLERKEKMKLSIKIPWSFEENAKKY